MSAQMCLLLVASLLSQSCCQHWSYGLSPGGKRDLDDLSDTLGNLVKGFPHADSPCSVLGCTDESDLPKIYRLKGFIGSVTARENGRRPFKK